jgi:ElaB/YqjD/DUF883 family membrane-anchored ribosome-binding protein
MDPINREPNADAPEERQTSGSVSGTAARMKRNLADKAEDAKQSLNDLGRKAADRFENSRHSTASALDWTASSLHSRADQISDFAHSAADRIQDSADYVRERDVDRIMEDARGVVKRYPGRSLVVAGALGFLLAATLKRIGS